jgi:hypothetical protein
MKSVFQVAQRKEDFSQCSIVSSGLEKIFQPLTAGGIFERIPRRPIAFYTACDEGTGVWLLTLAVMAVSLQCT